MKRHSLQSLLFLLLLFPRFNFQSSNSPPPDLIFFEVRDSSKSSGKTGSNSQFFESECDSFRPGMQLGNSDLKQGQCSNHYQNIIRMHSEQIRSPSSQSKFSFSFLKKHISNKKLQKACQGDHALVSAVKSYWRHGGYVPIEDTKKEIRRANSNKNHSPDFLDSIRIASYLFFNEHVPAHQRFQVKHEILGLCVRCNSENDGETFHHFIIDRNANAEIPDVWNTKIRVIYIGEGEDCKENDRGWAEKRTSGLTLRAQSFNIEDRNYGVTKVLRDIRAYFIEFPKYNALYNCQHFANNLYNKITGKKEEFISKEVMILKERGGKTNENKLFFNFEEK